MEEQWKPLKVIGPACEISSLGRVRQKVKIIKGVEKHNVIRKPTYLAGRQYYAFREGDRQENRFAHRLVADAFLPNPEKHKHVGFKTKEMDPGLHNIEWTTHPGSANGTSPSERAEIKRRLKIKDKGVDIARDFGISPSTVTGIKKEMEAECSNSDHTSKK